MRPPMWMPTEGNGWSSAPKMVRLYAVAADVEEADALHEDGAVLDAGVHEDGALAAVADDVEVGDGEAAASAQNDDAGFGGDVRPVVLDFRQEPGVRPVHLRGAGVPLAEKRVLGEDGGGDPVDPGGKEERVVGRVAVDDRRDVLRAVVADAEVQHVDCAGRRGGAVRSAAGSRDGRVSSPFGMEGLAGSGGWFSHGFLRSLLCRAFYQNGGRPQSRAFPHDGNAGWRGCPGA